MGKHSIISHNKPNITSSEICSATQVLRSGMISQGREVEHFEKEITDYLGGGHGVAVSSGTAALYMAIRAYAERKHIEKVRVPAYSCVALKNAASLAGKKIEFVDVKKNHCNIDTDLLDDELTIACHVYGFASKIKRKNVIEDCAQAIGANIDSKPVGLQTDLSVFSFYATKPITSGGQGGMVVAKNIEDAEFIRDLRNFDMKNDSVVRFNFQMSDIEAAIGRAQLKRLPELMGRRKMLARKYIESGVELWEPTRDTNWYRAVVKSMDQANLIMYLEEHGIRSIIPIEKKEIMGNFENVPNAVELSESLVSIPIYPALKDDEQDYIIKVLKGYIEKVGKL